MNNEQLDTESILKFVEEAQGGELVPLAIFKLHLDPYEFKAYFILRIIQAKSECGYVEKSSKFLCKLIGCTEQKLREIKITLQRERIELEGLKLINVTEREGKSDLIKLSPIWIYGKGLSIGDENE